MGIKINLDTQGIDRFYEIFNTKSDIKKQDIIKLFNTAPYKRMIDLFGRNVNLTKQSQWIDIFYEAYQLHLNGNKNTVDDAVKKNIIDSVLWALNEFDHLQDHISHIVNIIKKKGYITKATYYLPTLDTDIEINLELYIFMINACVEEGVILLDVSFASQLTESQLNDLLAHELHHYLKSYIAGVYPKTSDGHEDITRSLFALENEGTADMCSFEGLSFVYEYLGFMEKGLLKSILISPYKYIEELGQLIRNKIIRGDDTINVHDYLMHNQIVHPIGFTMATCIVSEYGIDTLRTCVGFPLEFLIKYHDALKLKTGKVFLDEYTIQYLQNNIYNIT